MNAVLFFKVYDVEMNRSVAVGPVMTTRVRTGGAIQVDPRYEVDRDGLATGGWDAVFDRSAPLVVEVGFGNGYSLAEMARRTPHMNFVGIELFGKGILKLTRRLERDGIDNVRVIKGDAVVALTELFDRGVIDEIHVNFPDPWPKRRHHKRRLVAPPFVELLYTRVRPGGLVHLATDFTCYAFQMRTVFEAHPGFANTVAPHRFRYHIPGRIRTKYERKFSALGATIRYLNYRRSER